MDIGFGVVRKPICKQCAHACIVIRVTAAHLRLLLYALICASARSGSLWL